MAIGIIMFAIGVYSGIYIDQNYKISKVAEPKELLTKAKELIEKYKKPDSEPSQQSRKKLPDD